MIISERCIVAMISVIHSMCQSGFTVGAGCCGWRDNEEASSGTRWMLQQKLRKNNDSTEGLIGKLGR